MPSVEQFSKLFPPCVSAFTARRAVLAKPTCGPYVHLPTHNRPNHGSENRATLDERHFALRSFDRVRFLRNNSSSRNPLVPAAFRVSLGETRIGTLHPTVIDNSEVVYVYVSRYNPILSVTILHY